MDQYLQIHLVDPWNVVGHPAKNETAHGGCEADAHEQNFLVGVRPEPLLHVFHLETEEETRFE